MGNSTTYSLLEYSRYRGNQEFYRSLLDDHKMIRGYRLMQKITNILE